MKRNFIATALLFSLFIWSCTSPEKYQTKTGEEDGYSYEYVTNDPMKTRVYTLENGLKVYLSDYKADPRIQVYIPVKAGGKNDPADNTGLAHYLEHMLFKGNDEFGTLDYAAEKPYLDSIESLFNQYAQISDPVERKAHYKLIDAVSQEAAAYAIPNEYDKLMAGIGGQGVNAYTTEDRTVYMVNIPANELDKFLEIESSRFRKIVNRLFHTELETVYEEKNQSLDSDNSKVFEKMYELAFPAHPYGTQTVIGTIDHLKNPSITEIEKYFNKYYKPNNMAICISGDIDYTKTIRMIEGYFGDWEPNESLEAWEKVAEAPITEPKEAEVFGPDVESLSFAFRFNGRSSDDYPMINLIDLMLNNSEAGIIDLNLLQKQEVLQAGTYVDAMNDYALHSFWGYPKEGQSLEELRDLLLAQLDVLKKGEFEDWLIPAVINDNKSSSMSGLESNRSRADEMVMAFTNDIPWADQVGLLDRMAKITKEEVVAFVNEHYKDNYIAVYKRTGEDPNARQVEKPEITKVPLNREAQSAFHKDILAKESPKLKPVFVDYQKDIERGTLAKSIEVSSKKNEENELFTLLYLLDIGSNNDPALKVAVEYLPFLGTADYTSEELSKEFYKLGCSFSVSAGADRTYVILRGLDENMEEALVLFEGLLNNAQPDSEALEALKGRTLKSRQDAKQDKGSILYSGLMNYGQYGAKSSFTNVLSNADLQNLTAQELVDKITTITDMEHRILYYGPKTNAELVSILNTSHNLPDELTPLPELVEFERADITTPKVYWAHYDMVQTEFMMLSKGETYDPAREAEVRMFNEYYDGGMNSVIFQEIREAQGLAYSAGGSYSMASKAGSSDLLYTLIGTQADKQTEAMAAIKELMNNMPESESAFEIARNAILSKLESERITKFSVLWNYESAKRKNLDYDVRKDVYEKIKTMTLEDLKAFHAEYIKNRKYNTVVIGNRDKIDFKDLSRYGQVEEVSLEALFGYGEVNPINTEVNK